MSNLLLKVLVVAIALISLSNCGDGGVKNEIVFKKGVNLELYYKDSRIEFTTLITLVDEKDETSVFTGVVRGKTVYDSFPIGGIIDYFDVENLEEIGVEINGLTINRKRILSKNKIFLNKDSSEKYKKTYEDKAPYMEIRAIKQNRLGT